MLELTTFQSRGYANFVLIVSPLPHPPLNRPLCHTQTDADGVVTTTTCWEHADQWQYMTACESTLTEQEKKQYKPLGSGLSPRVCVQL